MFYGERQTEALTVSEKLWFVSSACGLLQALIGRLAGDVFIDADKVGYAVIATTGGNFANRSIAATEHFFGLVDACAVEVLFKGHARYATKAARKITVTHAKTTRKLLFIHILGIVVANIDHRIVNQCRCLVVWRFFVGRGVASQNLHQKLHDFELNCHLGSIFMPLVFAN